MNIFSSIKKIMTIVILLAVVPGCSLFSPTKETSPKADKVQTVALSNIVSVTTKDELDKLLAQYKYVVVDFWAQWCAPCRIMKESNKELAKEFPNVVFVEINIDEAPVLVKDKNYSVQGIPNVFHFNNKNKVHQYVGKKEVPERRELIKKSFGL